MANLYGFNPRTRKGCDAKGYGVSEDAISFNPRTRKGCDPLERGAFGQGEVSIHAPVKDATILSLYLIHKFNRFQSTHP